MKEALSPTWGHIPEENMAQIVSSADRDKLEAEVVANSTRLKSKKDSTCDFSNQNKWEGGFLTP